jgi:CheY-like chemotaxis protein
MGRVLVMDDNENGRGELAEALENSGFQTDAFRSARRALQALCQATADADSYSAIVLNATMEGAWEALEAVDSNPLWDDIPVLVVSGNGQATEDVIRATEHDALYIEKQENFIQLVKAALERIVREA